MRCKPVRFRATRDDIAGTCFASNGPARRDLRRFKATEAFSAVFPRDTPFRLLLASDESIWNRKSDMKSLYRIDAAQASLSAITPPPPLPQKTVLRVRRSVHT
ncbi:hypothetical protein PBS_37810 [Paraburkholderia sp. 2C]